MSLGSRDASDAGAARDRRVVRVLGTIGVPLAIMFHGGVGALFGVLLARPAWNSGLFPIIFLVSALASGGALLTLVAAVFQDGWRRNRDTVVALGQLVLGILLLDVLFQVSEYSVALYGGVPDDVRSLELIMGGPYWWVFWVWQILVGTLVPIMLLALPTRRDPRWFSAAGLLIAAGFLRVRLNIVVPGPAPEESGSRGDRPPRFKHRVLPEPDRMAARRRDRRTGPLALRPQRVPLPQESGRDERPRAEHLHPRPDVWPARLPARRARRRGRVAATQVRARTLGATTPRRLRRRPDRWGARWAIRFPRCLFMCGEIHPRTS